MKTRSKYIFGFIAAIGTIFLLFSFSVNKTANTATVFADSSPAVQIPAEALAVAESMQTAFRAISAAVLPTVVQIDVVETRTVDTDSFEGLPFFFFGSPGDDDDSEPREYSQEGLGSGVIVRKTGDTFYVLTNDHVVGSATEISVTLSDGREYEAELVGADDRKDIALVSFETTDDDIPIAKLGDSDKVQTGDICIAMGTPLGYSASVTQGIVSATGRSGSDIGNISDFIQTDAAINRGNSGGPLLNIYGEVIGINTWIVSQGGGSQGLGFSIPINNVKKAIDDFISDGKVTYGWMGVSLLEVNEIYKEELDISGNEKGAFVAQIFLNSPAAKSGMQAGDFITALNGKEVRDVDQLIREVGDLTAGEIGDFEIIRGGKAMSLDVKIEARDEKTTTDNSKLWPGFFAAPLTDEFRKELDLEDSDINGVVVTGIQAKSPAATLRLQEGDIITAVNDKDVDNLAEFYSALETQKNSSIWFDVYNDGNTIETGKYQL